MVLYDPYLLIRYNCHINVDVCSNIKAVKNIYKYIYEGHDRVAVYVADTRNNALVDDLQWFQDA